MADKELKMTVDTRDVTEKFKSLSVLMNNLGKKKLGIKFDDSTIRTAKLQLGSMYAELDSKNKKLTKDIENVGKKMSEALNSDDVKKYNAEIINMGKELSKNARIMEKINQFTAEPVMPKAPSSGISTYGRVGLGAGGMFSRFGIGGTGAGLMGTLAAGYGLFRGFISPAIQAAGPRLGLRGLGMAGDEIQSLYTSGARKYGYSPTESFGQMSELLRGTGGTKMLSDVQGFSRGTGFDVNSIIGLMGGLRPGGMKDNQSLKFLKDIFIESVAKGMEKSRAFDALSVIASSTASMAANANINPQAVKNIMMGLMGNNPAFVDNPQRAMNALMGLNAGFTSEGPLAGIAYRSLLNLPEYKKLSPIELSVKQQLGFFEKGGASLRGAKEYIRSLGVYATGNQNLTSTTPITAEQQATWQRNIQAGSLNGGMSNAIDILTAFRNKSDSGLQKAMEEADKTLAENTLALMRTSDGSLLKIKTATEGIRIDIGTNIVKPLQDIDDKIKAVWDFFAWVTHGPGEFIGKVGGMAKSASDYGANNPAFNPFGWLANRNKSSPTHIGTWDTMLGRSNADRWNIMIGGVSQPLSSITPTPHGNFGDPRAYRGGIHMGNDIASPSGTPISSILGGTVISSGYYGNAGNQIKIRNSDGTTVVYDHMQESGMLPVGAKVTPGQTIGTVGTSGHSSGPHLHYEIRNKQGQAIDPYREFWPNVFASDASNRVSNAADIHSSMINSVYKFTNHVSQIINKGAAYFNPHIQSLTGAPKMKETQGK